MVISKPKRNSSKKGFVYCMAFVSLTALFVVGKDILHSLWAAATIEQKLCLETNWRRVDRAAGRPIRSRREATVIDETAFETLCLTAGTHSHDGRCRLGGTFAVPFPAIEGFSVAAPPRSSDR